MTHHLLGRPLKLLYPIECPLEKEEHVTDRKNANTQGETKDSEQSTVRPKRVLFHINLLFI